MNERIRELAKQAYIADASRNPNWKFKPETELLLKQLSGFNEKFAELIVKECAFLVNHQQRTTGYTTHAKMLCDEFGIEFKEEDYFGVEE